jgi:hypothetical protein
MLAGAAGAGEWSDACLAGCLIIQKRGDHKNQNALMMIILMAYYNSMQQHVFISSLSC